MPFKYRFYLSLNKKTGRSTLKNEYFYSNLKSGTSTLKYNETAFYICNTINNKHLIIKNEEATYTISILQLPDLGIAHRLLL